MNALLKSAPTLAARNWLSLKCTLS